METRCSFAENEMLKRKTIAVGPLQCNCSIIYCEKTREAIVVDPGDEAARINKNLADLGLKVKMAVHTHAHFDHIAATGGLKAASPEMKVSLHKADEQIYNSLPMQGQMFGFQFEAAPPIDTFLNDEEEFKLGEDKFKIIHTPGHSPGGVCVHFKEGTLAKEPVLFSGDTLFQQSVGRSDLWGGDHKQLVKSIKHRLLTLEDETFVMPGHGGSTTIADEARSNPFLK